MFELKIASYNLHKGRNTFGKKYSFERLKEFLQTEKFDIGLFQEVLGNHKLDSSISHQIELLADQKWPEYSFAKNSVVSAYDHGNAILSKFPIINEKILDLSLNRFEKRCAVLSTINLGETKIYCVCTHLNLLQKHRIKQIDKLLEFISKNIEKQMPILIGGDFNDWNSNVSKYLKSVGGFESYENDSQYKTFPSILPIFPLDRFFYRNLELNCMEVGKYRNFCHFSDHLPIFCKINIDT